MKLLNCLGCHDIIALSSKQIRTCLCGESKGYYAKNGVTAFIYGEKSRAIGFINSEYIKSLTQEIVPWQTYYKWFPIISVPEHHVIKFDNLQEFTQNF
jgi:hypothetical protein